MCFSILFFGWKITFFLTKIKNCRIETRTVDIHIAKLRRKIEPDPKQPVHLVTVRGAGYRLVADET